MDAIYPSDVRGLEWTVVRRPVFDTLVQSSSSKYETRLPQTKNPTWRWLLSYNYLYNTTEDFNNALLPGRDHPDLQIFMGFWLAQQGQFHSFLFRDPDFHSVGPALNDDLSPNLKAQLQLVSDSGTFFSPVQRFVGGQYFEDVTDLVTGSPTIAVYSAGTYMQRGVDYTVAGP